jgi:hypothetical protein
MKKNSTALRELREELHYWQMQAKMEARWLAGSRRKCHEIGAKMRALQAPIQPAVNRPSDWRPSEFESNYSQKEML